METELKELLEYLVTAAVIERAVELRGFDWQAAADAKGADLDDVDRPDFAEYIPQAARDFRQWRNLVIAELSKPQPDGTVP